MSLGIALRHEGLSSLSLHTVLEVLCRVNAGSCTSSDRIRVSKSSQYFFVRVRSTVNGIIIMREKWTEVFLWLTLTLGLYCAAVVGDTFEEDNYGVKYASTCEVCKVMVSELEAKLDETGKTGGLLETGYHLDKRLETKKEYKNSQLRLIETMEEACDGILKYNIHKERKDSTRFAKGQSQTFSTLHGLVNKGVKVDLGIPYEMWDKPSAEITHLKTQCEEMLEKYESEIEDWYNEQQENLPLEEYLCKNIVLKNQDSSCLYEIPEPERQKGEL